MKIEKGIKTLSNTSNRARFPDDSGSKNRPAHDKPIVQEGQSSRASLPFWSCALPYLTIPTNPSHTPSSFLAAVPQLLPSEATVSSFYKFFNWFTKTSDQKLASGKSANAPKRKAQVPKPISKLPYTTKNLLEVEEYLAKTGSRQNQR